jgi:hypothetical protein
MENNQLVSLSHNASAHRSVLVKDFLAKSKATALEHPHTFQTCVQLILYLFQRPKSAFKRWRFCNTTVIMKNATKELKRLSNMAFKKVSTTCTIADRSV